jgi:hypothetical protein
VLVAWICGALLGLSRLLPAQGIPSFLPGLDTCAFHAATGLPCPGCGLTRAFVAISHGRFHQAWGLHPFAFPLYAVCLAGLASPWGLRRFPALSRPRTLRLARWSAVAFLVAMMAFGTWRMVLVLHHPSPLWSQR